MGKSEIRIIHVPRWVTIALWILVTAAMISAINLLSGHAYHRESSFGDIAAMMSSSSVLLATIAPAMADILFFLPWGALAFLSLDGSGRPRNKVYLATLAIGVAFALALIAWQQWLPTRVTGGVDVLWNAAGCAAGAALAHARKRVRVRFE